MQAVSTSSLFQSAESELLGGYRCGKAQVVCEAGSARYGYPVQLDTAFDARALVSEGAGADGGRFRVLASKVLPTSSHVWTAEAGGVVRQVDLESGRTVNVYRGAQGPVPTLDFFTTPAPDGTRIQWLVTGSWDKALRFYRTSSNASKTAGVPVVTMAGAMEDFVKCVHTFPASSSTTMLAVGGSDKSVAVFDLSSFPRDDIPCVYRMKAHTRPVNALASLVALDGQTRLYSADSMGRILESIWSTDTLRLHVTREILGFQTAIYDLRVLWHCQEVEGQEAADSASSAHNEQQDPFVAPVREASDGSLVRQIGVLWAASADKSAAGYTLSSTSSSTTTTTNPTAGPSASTVKRAASIPIQGSLPPLTRPFARTLHADYVKAVLPLSAFGMLDADPMLLAGMLEHGLVTGSSDDHIRFFPHPNVDVGDTRRTADDEPIEVYEIEGHWNEVTSLEPWIRYPAEGEGEAGPHALPPATAKEYWIVSAGLDGSVRRWNVSGLTSFPPPRFSAAPMANPHAGSAMDAWNADSVPTPSSSLQMTADEEAELAELMDSD